MAEGEETDTIDLNPSTARVIGLVDNNGLLLDGEAKAEGVFNLLINLGAEDGVEGASRVLVFALGPEMTDPENNDPLGHFEIVRGEGRVTSVQTRMAIVKSTRTVATRVRKPQLVSAMIAGSHPEYEVREEAAPFRGPRVGDLVRFI